MPRTLGLRFGRLKIVARAGTPIRGADGRRTAVWCRCDCGHEKITFLTYLTKGHNKSCGCLPRNSVRGPAHPSYKHGLSKSPTMNSFDAMRNRCGNTKHKAWPDYGGRGIKVCKRWTGEHGFTNFLADLGERPIDKTLDREDVNGNYTPQNCRWADAKTQASNRRNSVKSLDFEFENLAEVF